MGKICSTTWQLLCSENANEIVATYPGIYVLAYSKERLTGLKVKPEQIFYVGMSNSKGGVKQRIKQFIQAINGKRNHSGGVRFRLKFLKGKKYCTDAEKKLYFSFLVKKCEVDKKLRKEKDLRNMGIVAKMEYDVIADVLKIMGCEPALNKK